MSDQLTSNPEALRLFFTEDIFLVDAPQSNHEGFKVAIEHSIPAVQVAEVKRVESTNAPEPTPQIKLPVVPEASDVRQVVADQGQKSPVEQPFSYVGANERNILILVNDDRHPVSTLQGRELLGNILKAINLNRNDCALVNYASCHDANFAQFNVFFKPQYLFAFGVSPKQLNIPGATYNSIVTQGESKLIFSINLDALSGDAATKKLLWASLKQINL